MILPRYVAAICEIDRDPAVLARVRGMLGLAPRPLIYALHAAGMGQADLVLALLHVPLARWHVENVLGSPITVLPPVRLTYPVNGPPRTRITHVTPNPRKPCTATHARYAATFRAGRTLEEARVRGATTRDIRQATRRGWIRIGVTT